METTVVNLRVQPYDVYIGRPSKWGNPFSHRRGIEGTEYVGTIENAVEFYEKYIKVKIRENPTYFDLDELRGMRLGCFCKPGSCHGDVLARLCDETKS